HREGAASPRCPPRRREGAARRGRPRHRAAAPRGRAAASSNAPAACATIMSGDARSELGALARLFLRLGTTAFGGPAAHIAMMQDEVVRRRRWMTNDEFLDLLGATNLIPGPNSTEIAIHVGHRRAGLAGLLVAGACFIVPATLTTGVLAWAYVR